MGIIWRIEGNLVERELLVTGEGWEEKRAKVQQNMATWSAEKSATCFQTHLHNTNTIEYVLFVNLYVTLEITS